MVQFSLIQKIILSVIPILFAITLHEVSHGWMALKLGDKTAKMLGRLSINPIKHIDLIGTILVPIAILLLTKFNFVFGWAKPVPVTWKNLKKPKRDMALVAIAGPFANLIMAIFWGILTKLGFTFFNIQTFVGSAIVYMGATGIIINIVLMVLNLIPIPPLDGSRIISSLLRGKADYYYNSVAPYGIFILLGLLVLGVLGNIIIPIVIVIVNLITTAFGLPRLM